MERVGVFARWPEPGRVKTRLSPALPASLACDLYVAMLEDALDAARASSAGERVLYWADPPAGGTDPPPAGFDVRIQRGADLGARLEAAFSELIREPGDRAVVLGADCPELDATRVSSALRSLDAHELVLGPTGDGGYYLIGLTRRAPDLFRGVEWGTSEVFDKTVRRARSLGLGVEVLPPLDDVDTPADLARWIGRLASGEALLASRAVAALRDIGLAQR